jgi:L-ribulose-5-phosphate 3-epimerase
MDVRFGVRGHDFGTAEPGELAAKIASRGFRRLQLAPTKALLGVGAKPGDLDATKAAAIRVAFAAHGVEIAVLGCYVNLVRPDQAPESLTRFEEYLRLAGTFGCRRVATETFSLEEGRKGFSEEGYRALVPAIARLAAAAEAAGAWVCVEPVASHIVSGPRVMRRLLDEVGSPSLKVLLDPVNLVDPETLAGAPGLLEDCLELLGDRVEAFHAKDFAVEGGKKLVVSPGMGVFDYRPTLARLLKAKPDMPVILEDQRPENLAAAAAFLAEGLGG